MFIAFLVANGAYLHRVPGLMGDEASEGENVFELLQSETITLTGERSYIGPAPDYLRVPFIAAFGYSALALRIPLYLASIATFLLTWSIFRRLLSKETALLVLAVAFFSPTYLSYQRLGWAITLFPLFAVLIIWLLMSHWRHRAVLAGFVAGIGLHTHIMFLPTLAAIAAVWVVVELVRSGAIRERTKRVLAWWPAIIGFWAAFATQFVILLQFTDDQGDPGAVGELISDRFKDLPDILPLVISGSSYVARYTGLEFAPGILLTVTGIVLALSVLGLVLGKHRKIAWLWLLGIAMHLVVLMYMIDRFTLRYFVIFVLGLWLLAAIGLGVAMAKLPDRWRQFTPLVVALALLLWSAAAMLAPFLRTGGSVADFSLGNRTNSAAALVDTRPLVTCLRGAGSVTSEGVHIFNRLQYFSHQYSNLEVLPETQKNTADFLVHYRQEGSPEVSAKQELCPDLNHFIVERR